MGAHCTNTVPTVSCWERPLVLPSGAPPPARSLLARVARGWGPLAAPPGLCVPIAVLAVPPPCCAFPAADAAPAPAPGTAPAPAPAPAPAAIPALLRCIFIPAASCPTSPISMNIAALEVAACVHTAKLEAHGGYYVPEEQEIPSTCYKCDVAARKLCAAVRSCWACVSSAEACVAKATACASSEDAWASITAWAWERDVAGGAGVGASITTLWACSARLRSMESMSPAPSSRPLVGTRSFWRAGVTPPPVESPTPGLDARVVARRRGLSFE